MNIKIATVILFVLFVSEGFRHEKACNKVKCSLFKSKRQCLGCLPPCPDCPNCYHCPCLGCPQCSACSEATTTSPTTTTITSTTTLPPLTTIRTTPEIKLGASFVNVPLPPLSVAILSTPEPPLPEPLSTKPTPTQEKVTQITTALNLKIKNPSNRVYLQVPKPLQQQPKKPKIKLQKPQRQNQQKQQYQNQKQQEQHPALTESEQTPQTNAESNPVEIKIKNPENQNHLKIAALQTTLATHLNTKVLQTTLNHLHGNRQQQQILQVTKIAPTTPAPNDVSAAIEILNNITPAPGEEDEQNPQQRQGNLNLTIGTSLQQSTGPTRSVTRQQRIFNTNNNPINLISKEITNDPENMEKSPTESSVTQPIMIRKQEGKKE